MTPGDPTELRIGRITKAHGVGGAMRVELLTDFPDRFAAGNSVEVDGRRLTVTRSQEQDGSLLVNFNEIKDRTAAEALTGLYCTVPLAAARSLPVDHYYHFQLVGLSVFDARRQRSLGRVEEVLSYAANDVLRVADGQREVLVPMLKSVVRGIEPDKGIIMVDLPDEAEP
ncbi:MAG: 16S rRNA processing protein RimM [Chloroflexi bacterium]|nr:MAG: 16S rRNA processing protein RimM [Chloroflexota bacterium]